MAITIKKLSVESGKPIYRKIMIYGDSGSGKTYLAGSAQDVPDMRGVLIADCDGGSATLLSRGDTEVVPTRNLKDLEELLWAFAKGDKSVAHVKTLVIDGASELAKQDLAEIAATEAAHSDKRNRDVNELRDYLKAKSRMLRVFRMARDLENINVIITCWAKKEYPKIPGTQNANKAAEPSAIVPDFSEAIRNTIMGYTDDTFYMHFDGDTGNRVLYSANCGPVAAKTRDDAVAKLLTTDGQPLLTNPTFSAIYSAYKRAYSAKKEK